MAVPNLPVAISYTPWHAFPNKFPTISPNLQAVAVIPSFCLITHESEECHINRSHPKLESFKMKAEILAKTVENLKQND
jgi:hypothetical protein